MMRKKPKENKDKNDKISASNIFDVENFKLERIEEGFSAEDGDLYSTRYNNRDFLGIENGIEYWRRGGDTIFALKKEGEKAGSIQVTNNWINNIEVDKSYYRCGIGSRLVYLAIEYLGLQKIPCVKHHRNYDYCLTDNGEELVAACIKRGIIHPSMCIFPEDEDDDEKNRMVAVGEEDPKLPSEVVMQAISYVNGDICNINPIRIAIKKLPFYERPASQPKITDFFKVKESPPPAESKSAPQFETKEETKTERLRPPGK